MSKGTIFARGGMVIIALVICVCYINSFPSRKKPKSTQATSNAQHSSRSRQHEDKFIAGVNEISDRIREGRVDESDWHRLSQLSDLAVDETTRGSNAEDRLSPFHSFDN